MENPAAAAEFYDSDDLYRYLFQHYPKDAQHKLMTFTDPLSRAALRYLLGVSQEDIWEKYTEELEKGKETVQASSWQTELFFTGGKKPKQPKSNSLSSMSGHLKIIKEALEKDMLIATLATPEIQDAFQKCLRAQLGPEEEELLKEIEKCAGRNLRQDTHRSTSAVISTSTFQNILCISMDGFENVLRDGNVSFKPKHNVNSISTLKESCEHFKKVVIPAKRCCFDDLSYTEGPEEQFRCDVTLLVVAEQKRANSDVRINSGHCQFTIKKDRKFWSLSYEGNKRKIEKALSFGEYSSLFDILVHIEQLVITDTHCQVPSIVKEIRALYRKRGDVYCGLRPSDPYAAAGIASYPYLVSELKCAPQEINNKDSTRQLWLYSVQNAYGLAASGSYLRSFSSLVGGNDVKLFLTELSNIKDKGTEAHIYELAHLHLDQEKDRTKLFVFLRALHRMASAEFSSLDEIKRSRHSSVTHGQIEPLSGQTTEVPKSKKLSKLCGADEKVSEHSEKETTKKESRKDRSKESEKKESQKEKKKIAREDCKSTTGSKRQANDDDDGGRGPHDTRSSKRSKPSFAGTASQKGGRTAKSSASSSSSSKKTKNQAVQIAPFRDITNQQHQNAPSSLSQKTKKQQQTPAPFCESRRQLKIATPIPLKNSITILREIRERVCVGQLPDGTKVVVKSVLMFEGFGSVEIKITKLVQGHSGVVRLIACDEKEGTIVMPMLRSFPRWGLSRDRIRQVMRELLEALDWIHSKGIVHRDIAPSNLMLDDAGHVVIIDFESAALLSDFSTRNLVNHLGYASESAAYPCVDPDLYAAGLILFEMLTGCDFKHQIFAITGLGEICLGFEGLSQLRDSWLYDEFDLACLLVDIKRKHSLTARHLLDTHPFFVKYHPHPPEGFPPSRYPI